MPSPPNTADAIVVRAADFGHGRRAALSDVDLRITPGSRVLVTGANGSGKSTFVATLAGLLPPVAGQVSVLGLDPLRDRRTLHQHIGFMGHGDVSYPDLTAYENLLYHARLRGLGPDAVQEALDVAGLRAVAQQRVATFSHGTARRVGLAKALLGAPRLVLLDEPDSGLDGASRSALIARLSADTDRTVVLTTHQPDAFRDWADRRLHAEDGHLIDATGGGR